MRARASPHHHPSAPYRARLDAISSIHHNSAWPLRLQSSRPAPSPSRRLPARAFLPVCHCHPAFCPCLSQLLNVSKSDTPIIASIKGNLRARLLIRRVAYAVTKLTAPSASPNHGVWCRQSCIPPQPLGAACRMAHAGSNGCHQASLTSLARRITFPYWQEWQE